jgi:hypothetical protein
MMYPIKGDYVKDVRGSIAADNISLLYILAMVSMASQTLGNKL